MNSFLRVVCAATLLAVAGCGGGGGGGGSSFSPAASPSPAPQSGSLAATPSSVMLLAVGDSQTVTLADGGNSGPFTLTPAACSGVASLASGSVGTSFNVTAAGTGTCSIAIADTLGHTITLSVMVTTTSGTLQ